MSGTATTAPDGEERAEGAAPDAPAAPLQVPEAPPAPARGRALRATALRWGAAVAVFATLAGGVGYGLTRLEREELPGLAREHDGRWDYPELSLPALPYGSPRPFSDANLTQSHHADLRDLLLPAPEGAEAAEGLPGPEGGWSTVDAFLAAYAEEDRPRLRLLLLDHAVRHTAARGWVMPDGTRTSVHLLRFNTGAVASRFRVDAIGGDTRLAADLAGTPDLEPDPEWEEPTASDDIAVHAYDEQRPRGGTHTRMAQITAGDVVAVIVQERAGGAPAVPFDQTVVLQGQLLG
ncbi:hypothetical protein [Streptomyces chumphonensis]|uniref:hypothetical protein n=1 Tax=Streptomyces chumphonensis TaxID=1214925 RepID=UPI003D73E6DC